MNPADFQVRAADWNTEQAALRAVRTAVFVREQGVSLELEWDGRDVSAIHVLAADHRQTPIGTARMLPDGHIGRMAVLAAWRRRGVGSTLLLKLLKDARDGGLNRVFLNAQTHAVPFYGRHGFRVLGDPFTDAGIPHLRMIRDL
ncbi:MAG: GNAT family N-acetyltransferase [Gammaproteobacteria bacterium]